MSFGEPEDDRPLFTPRLVITGAAIVGIVIFALVAVLTRSSSGTTTASKSSPATHAPAASRTSPATSGAVPAASPASGSGVCNVPPGSQAIPQSTPTGVTWQLYDTVALPSSAQAGPTVVDGGVARCYAHSPLGALLAAANISVRYVLAPDWQDVIAEQVVPGTGRNVYAAQRPTTNVTVTPGEFGQFAGFQFVTYTSAVAVIQVVVQLPNGVLQTTPMTVQWSGTDWRLELQPDGQPGPDTQQISNLNGFIPWAGV